MIAVTVTKFGRFKQVHYIGSGNHRKYIEYPN